MLSVVSFFGRGFDSRRLHQFLQPKEIQRCPTARSNAGFFFILRPGTDNDIWRPSGGNIRGKRILLKGSCPMSLTNTNILKVKPGEKPLRLFDERGLYLEVSPAGGKWWRWKYRFGGKEKRLSLGV